MDMLYTTHVIWRGKSGLHAHFAALSRALWFLRLFGL